MKISVVIPTLNRCDQLRGVLSDLQEQVHTNFEVLIIDGGSTDQTEKICNDFSKFIDIRFYRQKQPGIVSAMNEALGYCTGNIFTRTDDDVSFSGEWLKEIVETFNKHPDAAGVTGPTLIPPDRMANRDLTMFNQKIREKRNLFWSLFKLLYHDYFMEGSPFAVSRFYRCGAFSLGSNFPAAAELKEIFEVDYLESCNWSMKLDLIKQINGFDQRFGGVSEYFEADAVYKIKKLGYKMYFNPRALIKHLVAQSGNFKARGKTYGRALNFILFYLRHIKPNTLDKAIRFSAYLIFINTYFLFCAFKYKQPNQLGAWGGTIVGLVRYSPELFS